MNVQTITPPRRQVDDGRARVPLTAHLRELQLADGRKLLLDRRSIAFLCEGKPEEFAGKVVTVVGFKTMGKACPVTVGYQDLKTWWRGDQFNATGGQS